MNLTNATPASSDEVAKLKQELHTLQQELHKHSHAAAVRRAIADSSIDFHETEHVVAMLKDIPTADIEKSLAELSSAKPYMVRGVKSNGPAQTSGPTDGDFAKMLFKEKGGGAKAERLYRQDPKTYARIRAEAQRLGLLG